ncbi:hypothetical protein GCM10007978_24100 [Shewanella hanedai]|uniref:Uncharacterized protein n=1 Tax=Shewanella hanedai TaxID=25 RepID=A0A553JMY7_SHEHA|nr:hypothetical protein [Shewanella hanedai]TRY13826.1 hypothetical protein FN961_12980 [Shewanella hanedai]GGI85609.1 hypothetical protein GCM10007978_24100 [Shewanella hanedai]
MSRYDGGFNSDVSAFCYQPEAPVKLVSCAVTYTTILPIQDYVPVTRTTMTSSSQWKWKLAHYGDDKKSCPPNDEELKEFEDGYDMDGDGFIDRCYNPLDKLKTREPATDFCLSEPEAFTLDEEQDSKIKSAASDARQNLEQMESDLANPNETNKAKLDQIAALFGMSNSQDPQFTILASVINTSSLGCVKNKLAAAELDPSTSGYLSFIASSKKRSGVYCQNQNGGDIIQINVKDLDFYDPRNSPDELQELVVHEVKHACYDKHDDAMHYMDDSEIRADFDKLVEGYGNIIGSGSEHSVLQRLIRNPYFFEYILKVYL